jgi:POT family proton-dependent oligopeptide transporter
MFWCLFDQTASVWVEQAKFMDRDFSLRWLHAIMPEQIPEVYTIQPSQVQATNPLLILILVPLFTWVIYPTAEKVVKLTPLRKISTGFFVSVIAFGMSAVIEAQIENGVSVHVAWQMLAYVVLTAAEVMVSITCLEFSYTQAPPSMKSFVMSLYLLSVAAGNLLVAVVNGVIQDEEGNRIISGANYYWLFTGAMFVSACLFIVVAVNYHGKTYVQPADNGA